MIWERLSDVWQCCIEGAWSAYCHGSLPHGAAIVDAQGKLVAHGRNRIREQVAEGREFTGNRLAHAELNALMALDWRAVDIYSCTLYSIIEPCAMCTGAVSMAHMKGMHYAVRDHGAGGASLVDKTPFLKSVNVSVVGPEDPVLEIVLLAIQVEATLSQSHRDAEEWVQLLAGHLPEALKLGKDLFAMRSLQQWKEEAKDAAFVIDQIHARYMQNASA